MTAAEFGTVLKNIRVQARLTQEELAARAGLSVRSVRDVERGGVRHPRPETARLLGRALGLSGDDLDGFVAQARADYWAERGAAPSTVHPWQQGPAQLPVDMASFVGRQRLIRELDALLDRQPAPGVAIVVLTGTAGVGKTALAVRWAHRVRGHFPDGQLYVNLRGYGPGGPPISPGEAIRTFLAALHVPADAIPVSLDAQAGLYRSLLADRRMLVLLDNARNADQVRPLLPGSPTCVVVVTSRHRLTSLVAAEGAHPITVDVLSAAAARGLLTRRLGDERVRAARRAVDEIVERCARLPLALAIVAARAVTYPELSLTDLADELRGSGGGLEMLHGGDATSDVRTVLSWSYETMTSAAARLFRLLALHPGPDISAPAAASLAGASARTVRPLLDELARAHLLGEPRPGRYACHDLLRAYGLELAQGIDGKADRRAARHRMLDHYLHSAQTAARILEPGRESLALAAPLPGVGAEVPADIRQAMTWFTVECPVLMGAVAQAASNGFDTHTWQLVWTMNTFFGWRGGWYDWVSCQRAGLRAARRLADPTAEAHAHHGLARGHIRLGTVREADRHLRIALDLYGRIGDQAGQARMHHGLAHILGRQGRPAEALAHDQRSLALFEAAGHRWGQADALNSIGWNHTQLGEHRRALGYCRRALALHGALGNHHGQAVAYDSVGFALHHLGHHEWAAASFRRALDIFRDLGDRYNEAETLSRLGDAYRDAGRLDTACATWRLALAIFDRLHHPDAAQVRAKIKDSTGE